MRRERLSGRTGAAFDPCCALQTTVEIPAGGQATVVWFLGQAETREQARALIQRYRSDDLDARLKAVTDGWAQVLGTVQVKTPDRALDLMLNQWLLYQTLACRVWARTAFYQASGAYGFRDQLQDVMALAVARPDLTRAQILKAASRQFVEGDVQHWWHEPAGRGVRTRISDDLLWLPYVASHYLDVTGDRAILDEAVPFLEGPVLGGGPAGVVLRAAHRGDERDAVRALRARARSQPRRRGARPAAHGDGGLERRHESRGRRGQGRKRVARLVPARGARRGRRSRLRAARRRARWPGAHAAALREGGSSAKAWDGSWYRRAYFDDGTPLGSAGNDECAIDSIAQSWSVMSGAADPERARRAMASLDQHLVRRATGLVLLLTPPFDKTPLEPGYIKGYVPGVRENGGQYTHAAAWAVIAFASSRRRRQGRRAAGDAQSHHARDDAERACGSTGSSRTSSRATSTPRRRTSAAAAGPGTPGRPAGCTAPGSNGCSASGCRGHGW